MTVIAVENLSVLYEKRPALVDVNWHVEGGELAAIIGPNGGGKSTLLKTMIGLLNPTRGTVRILGQRPRLVRPQIAYLPQSDEVEWDFPISGYDVVLQGRLPMKRIWQQVSQTDKGIAHEALERVNMTAHSGQPIGELSGGQKQRIFLARALAQRARVIILDEPATGLDASSQHELLELFLSLRAQGITIVMSTHDLTCLAEGFDTVLALNKGVIAQGNPKDVLSEGTISRLFARHFPVVGANTDFLQGSP